MDVQTAIAAAMPLLPAGMPAPPSFRKNNPADQPIMLLNLTSSTLPMSVLDDYAETMIAPRISMVSGVSQVQVQGAAKYAVRVQVDPDKLHAQQHRHQRSRPGAAELERQPADRAAVRPARPTFNIKAGGQLMNADAFRPIVVTYRNGAPVRLEQVANVIDSVENVIERLVVLHRSRTASRAAARDHAAGDAPAGQQHHRGHRRRARAAAGASGAAAAVGPPHVRGRTGREPSARRSRTSRSRCSSRWCSSSA